MDTRKSLRNFTQSLDVLRYTVLKGIGRSGSIIIICTIAAEGFRKTTDTAVAGGELIEKGPASSDSLLVSRPASLSRATIVMILAHGASPSLMVRTLGIQKAQNKADRGIPQQPFQPMLTM
jgi:hypothetical protein